MAIVYVITNVVNGKKYLGKCVHNKPWYFGSGLAIRHAIEKYGKHNFIKEIIHEVPTIEEAAKIEFDLSVKFNVVADPMWYNLKYGGLGGSLRGRLVGEETRNRISISKKGMPSWNIGLAGTDEVKHTEETKKKISAGNIGKGSKPGNLHPCAKHVIFTDALNNEYLTDMISAGVIDPTKVEKLSIENATSGASMFLTIETVSAEEPKILPNGM
jgi:hypothetical protein